MENQVKELRVKIDGLARLTKQLKPITLDEKYSFFKKPHDENSKEIEKAVDSLYLAKAWLGKVLGELGTETPYKNDGKRKSVEDIEPTADVYPKEIEGHKIGTTWRIEGLNREPNHIEKVDWLRQEIKKLSGKISCLPDNDYRLDLYEERAEQYLDEARFWLGFELGRIREENKE